MSVTVSGPGTVSDKVNQGPVLYTVSLSSDWYIQVGLVWYIQAQVSGTVFVTVSGTYSLVQCLLQCVVHTFWYSVCWYIQSGTVSGTYSLVQCLVQCLVLTVWYSV